LDDPLNVGETVIGTEAQYVLGKRRKRRIYINLLSKGKAVQLHAMEALGGRGV
jgi:hypothetical protein